METKKATSVETTTLQAVPAEERKGWLSIAMIWAGNVICVPALMVGGMVSAGLNFKQSVLAMLIGYGIVVAYMTLLGIASTDLGVPSTVSISRAYGTRGAGVAVSLIIAVSMTGWFGFQTYVCANSFCMIMANFLGVNIPLWLSIIFWGCAMFITSVYGIGMIRILNMISVPALFILLIYGVINALGQPGAAATIASYAPPTPTPMLTGITLAVGGFAAGSVLAGDYTRYCKNRKDTVISSIVGVIPAGVGALVIGALLAITAGNYDITMMFSNIGLPVIGLIVLILATWTTNTGNAYSAGIAVVNIFKLKDNKRSLATLICGAVGTLLALLGIIDLFVPFLSILGYAIPPIAGVAIADYWIKGKGNADKWKAKEGVNWLGVISWLAGTAVAAFLPNFFIPTINAIVVSMLVYVLLTSVVKSPQSNPFAKED